MEGTQGGKLNASADSLAVYGVGGFGREVAWLAAGCGRRIVAFIDDAAERPARLHDIEVLPLEAFLERGAGTALVVAISNAEVRRRVVTRLVERRARFDTLVHPGVAVSAGVRIGAGSIVCAGTILTIDITIGHHVHVNLDCTIGHDAVIEDFATLAPGVHVSGNVRIGEGAFVGTGATIVNGVPGRPLVIERGSVVAAGACVVSDTEPHTLVAGVPAVLKKRYG